MSPQVGFLKILHKYEITFQLPPLQRLGRDVCAVPVPNLNLRVIAVTPLPEGKVPPLSHPLSPVGRTHQVSPWGGGRPGVPVASGLSPCQALGTIPLTWGPQSPPGPPGVDFIAASWEPWWLSVPQSASKHWAALPHGEESVFAVMAEPDPGAV